MKEIYEIVAEMTLKMVKKEKETKLSKRTLRMISLTERLHNSLYRKQ